ncbi:DoxX family membrane protein [Marinomonas sp. C2222]|uniref:DoxX family membrane protein n=1 Tax=Marinomonas sargassi TaxID=2984494 RepID=A0ABT2YPC3_9GAMM|nr:DoxX family membrane protein [Marinomonas sargassi]MCV2401600.1 DoxX family membrane protein [Marinomonas sargassi]
MSTVTVSREKLSWSLFGLRLGVFVVFLIWTLDKFVNPGHAAVVMKVFYSMPDVSANMAYLLGAAQLVLTISFLVGFQKRWVTLLILLMHLSSTLVSYGRYIDPWSGSNLLFFAAWPMLAATVALYLLREYDTKFTLAK